MPGNDPPLLEKVFMGENKLNYEHYFDLNAHARFFRSALELCRWKSVFNSECPDFCSALVLCL